jgi:DNA-binding CsgD family transcriptional regulator
MIEPISPAIPPYVKAGYDGLPALVDSIGEESFGNRLLGFLSHMSGAEHCAVFRLGARGPIEITAVSLDGTDTAHRQSTLYLKNRLWRFDPVISAAQEIVGPCAPHVQRSDISKLSNTDFRNLIYARAHIKDRIVVYGKVSETMIGLSILRSDRKGEFADTVISELSEVAQMLLSVLSKHSDVISERARCTSPLRSLADIEACLAQAPECLSRREAEVCARILYGISTLGISLDLNIGEETVTTYRKRAYQRLAIGSQRELLSWYLDRWAAFVRSCSARSAAGLGCPSEPLRPRRAN